ADARIRVKPRLEGGNVALRQRSASRLDGSLDGRGQLLRRGLGESKLRLGSLGPLVLRSARHLHALRLALDGVLQDHEPEDRAPVAHKHRTAHHPYLTACLMYTSSHIRDRLSTENSRKIVAKR